MLSSGESAEDRRGVVQVFGLADLLVAQGYQRVASHHQRRGFIGRHRSGLPQRQLQHFGFGSEVVSGGLQEVGMTDLEGEAEERKDVAPARLRSTPG